MTSLYRAPPQEPGLQFHLLRLLCSALLLVFLLHVSCDCCHSLIKQKFTDHLLCARYNLYVAAPIVSRSLEHSLSRSLFSDQEERGCWENKFTFYTEVSVRQCQWRIKKPRRVCQEDRGWLLPLVCSASKYLLCVCMCVYGLGV